MIDDDIDAIIQRGEERTNELNSKYEGLNLEDLNNFKSDASVQQWDGEDFRSGASFYTISFFPTLPMSVTESQGPQLQLALPFEAWAED